MRKLILFFAFFNTICSETNLIFSVQEKIMENVYENGALLPLIVKPQEDVTDDIEIKCNGNIRYVTSDGHYPDLSDEEILTKIEAGTKAGSEIKFNCIIVFTPIINVNITLKLDNSLTNWSCDEKNKVIQFVPKFNVNPVSSTSNNLEKDEELKLNMNIMSDVSKEISIEDGTFILIKEDNSSSINLNSCSKIPKEQKKGNLIITCKVGKEVKEEKFNLELGAGKTIDGIEPKVSGTISFSSKNKIEEIEEKDAKTSESSSNSKKLQFIWVFMCINLLLL